MASGAAERFPMARATHFLFALGLHEVLRLVIHVHQLTGMNDLEQHVHAYRKGYVCLIKCIFLFKPDDEIYRFTFELFCYVRILALYLFAVKDLVRVEHEVREEDQMRQELDVYMILDKLLFVDNLFIVDLRVESIKFPIGK